MTYQRHAKKPIEHTRAQRESARACVRERESEGERHTPSWAAEAVSTHAHTFQAGQWMPTEPHAFTHTHTHTQTHTHTHTHRPTPSWAADADRASPPRDPPSKFIVRLLYMLSEREGEGE